MGTCQEDIGANLKDLSEAKIKYFEQQNNNWIGLQPEG